MMKERPILFSGEMVRAILDGRKTQTRRVVKPQPDEERFSAMICGYSLGRFWTKGEPNQPSITDIKNPYGKPGNRLWVRETHVTGWPAEGIDIQQFDDSGNELPRKVWYRADGKYFQWVTDEGDHTDNIPWKPSIHMPRWASRITLEITNVRVERLIRITSADIANEGVEVRDLLDPRDRVERFADLWDKINGKKHPWASNPWVWVVEFKTI